MPDFSRKNCFPAALVAGIALAGAAPVLAAVPLGGLTVAVSPKGDQLVAGGDNRVIYVLDPQTLEVKKRVAFPAPIVRMGFDAGGGMLGVSDNDGTLYLIETGGWTTKATQKNRHRASFSAAKGLVASTDTDYRSNTVSVTSLADGKDVFTVKLPAQMPVAAMGISPDGTRLAVMLGPNDDKSEPKVAYSDVPKDLKGQARKLFELKNDGKTSLVQIYDIKTGKQVSEQKTYFTMNHSASLAAFIKDGLLFNEYSNNGVEIGADGEGRLVQFSGSYLYGSGVSHDGKFVLGGSLRDFVITDTSTLSYKAGEPEKLGGVVKEIDKLPGFPEYFKGFDATAGGSAMYGATSAYRVVKFDSTGKIIKAAPVF
ncbi:MAG TPA: hypothetical protein PLE50_02585 [Rhabdaerophilum sp.]|nr:hypothetical protein [Rhabdaerophilum sp.]